MFSNVRGFTTISEKLDPRALSDLLNQYLTPMTKIVFSNQGTLDKYMGDAIMAFFGAPISYKDHAKYACRCALQSLEKLYELQKDYEKKGLPAIDIGIGGKLERTIHADSCVIDDNVDRLIVCRCVYEGSSYGLGIGYIKGQDFDIRVFQ